MLNHGLSGHSNTSCDIDVFSKPGIHFGFLMLWSQACSWAYCKQPWLLGDEPEAVFTAYAKLRYRMLPYVYSAPHVANQTGMPMMRAMRLAFPDDRACRELLSQYMLGHFLLVGTFEPTVYISETPGGRINFWTGEPVTGGGEAQPTVPEDRGGVLLVCSGALIPMWPEMKHVGARPVDRVELHVYPGDASASVLYEDDGTSLSYRDGAVATTTIDVAEGGSITIGPRKGSYEGMPAERRFAVIVHTPESRDGLEIIEVVPPSGESFDVSW